MNVYDEIRAEREAQDAKWGGQSHDDGHDGLDWVTYIMDHSARILSGVLRVERHPDVTSLHDRQFLFTVRVPSQDARNTRAYRRQLVRVAALAVAAIESYDRQAAR